MTILSKSDPSYTKNQRIILTREQFDSAMEDARIEGYNEGIAKGYKDGYDEGLDDGREEVRNEIRRGEI